MEAWSASSSHTHTHAHPLFMRLYPLHSHGISLSWTPSTTPNTQLWCSHALPSPSKKGTFLEKLPMLDFGVCHVCGLCPWSYCPFPLPTKIFQGPIELWSPPSPIPSFNGKLATQTHTHQFYLLEVLAHHYPCHYLPIQTPFILLILIYVQPWPILLPHHLEKRQFLPSSWIWHPPLPIDHARLKFLLPQTH